MTTWIPMESNPDVMTKFIYKLGVVPKWNVVDVYGLDEEMLGFISKPVKAVILLFPCSEAYETHRAAEDAALKENPPKLPNDLFYMKQVIHNACGTIALVHSIANNKDIELRDGIIKDYLNKAKELSSPEERGKVLESDAAFTSCHQEIAVEGQTELPTDAVNHHFVTFLNKNDTLYELDGRKSFPIAHGPTTDDTLLKDAVKICKEFMARDPNELRFTVLAINPSESA